MFPTSGTDPFRRSLVCSIATNKAKSAESIMYQQNLFNQAEETMFNVLTRSVARSGEKENGCPTDSAHHYFLP